MTESRTGETIRITMEHIGEDGKSMQDLVINWHGFNNKFANLFNIHLVRKILDYVEELNSMKHPEGK